jgi:hypothetical protein
MPVSRGKYPAQKKHAEPASLDRFWEEHPSEADRKRFQQLLDLMSRGASRDGDGSHARGCP